MATAECSHAGASSDVRTCRPVRTRETCFGGSSPDLSSDLRRWLVGCGRGLRARAPLGPADSLLGRELCHRRSRVKGLDAWAGRSLRLAGTTRGYGARPHSITNRRAQKADEWSGEDVDTVVPLWIGSTRRTRVGMRHEDSVRSAAQGAHGLQ